MEERLEFVLHDRDRGIGVMPPLVLLPAEANLVLEEGHGKENLARPCSSSNSKIILTLLIEVIVVHMRLSVIYV